MKIEVKEMTVYYAHTGASSDKAEWQTLKEHSLNVAEQSSKFAESLECSEWAYAAGLLHDMGKGCREFQQRLDGRHPAIDHSIAGAAIASSTGSLTETFLVKEGHVILPVIAGHHTGLQDFYGEHSLKERLEAYKRGEIPQVSLSDIGASVPEGDSSVGLLLQQLCMSNREHQRELLSFGVFALEHLLFSALVDADWLDTERFMSPDEYARRKSALSAQASLRVLSERLDAYLETFDSEGPVNRARSYYLNQAQESASLPPGIFELNMPTGSGKTLTSLSFALRHAMTNGQERVIYAIPFMSIVEQNAKVFRSVLGPESIVEHVSSYDYGLTPGGRSDSTDLEIGQSSESRERGLKERMLAQNWDAPVVVTTNVQLFESLFSNRVSRSRKVHNIANSIIVLDEAQTLPDSLLLPTLAMLESLVALAHVSVVLCTATQPSLDKVWPFGTKPVSLVEDSELTDDVFDKRVEFDCSHAKRSNAYRLDELVAELVEEEAVLCVVSSRRAARLLFDSTAEYLGDTVGLYHLSALMVPEHRSKVLDDIRERLKEKLPCRVISTQLVEAGVDIDFPLVYREIAGTDSMLQAAGRCNREGRLSGCGRVVIFDCVEFDEFRPSRPNWLGKMRALGLEELTWASERGVDPFGKEGVKHFFDRRHQTGSLDGSDGKSIYGLVAKADVQTLQEHVAYGRYPHETIARRYRFFKEEDISLFVPWGEDGKELLELIEQDAFGYELFVRLQRFTVTVSRYAFNEYERAGFIRHIGSFPVPVLESRNGLHALYDDKRGLLAPGEEELELLVI